MCTLYERIQSLCKNKGVSGSRMCLDLGLSKSTLSDMKSGRKSGVSIATAKKIADYLGVSVDYLLNGEERTKEAPAETGKGTVSDDEIKFALFGGDGEITDEMYARVKQFAAFIKQEEAEKKKE